MEIGKEEDGGGEMTPNMNPSRRWAHAWKKKAKF